MIKSMTGFGKGETLLEHKKITVEIRSLNSKQLDLSVKLPAIYRALEYDIRNRIGKRLLRGKVDAPAAFDAYYAQLRRIAENNGIAWNTSEINAAAISSILRLPDVIQNDTQDLSDEETDAIMNSLDQALDRIDAFRLQEGATLIADLLHRISKIEQLKEEIIPFEKARTETIKTRIRENIESLGIPYDTNRLEQEMIYYIEKLDITEEKIRLQNHCRYFREVAHTEEGVGRKLGFIAQELGREINTLGSKANEATIQKKVVEMKDELEKIKEQVLNIL